MKVGIMTFPNSTSYGAVLQMYALYSTLTAAGCKTEVINYHNHYMKDEMHMSTPKNAHTKNRTIQRKVVHFKQYREFRVFEKNMEKYPRQTIHSKEDLLQINSRYSHVICGSDQVWNPDITGHDMSYFLDFCDAGTKRISYAPSFGISEFSEPFKEKIYPELTRFSAVSAREQEGKQFLENMLQREVPLVLDPTFLLDSTACAREEDTHFAAQKPYILYYAIKRSRELFDFSLDLARKKNSKIVVVGGNFLSNIKNKQDGVEYAWDISPRQWLYLVHHADCIVTNSFHGTAFSINYQKEFFVEFSSDTNSRLRQLIQTTGLENRVIGKDTAQWDSKVDYTQVNLKLTVEKELS